MPGDVRHAAGKLPQRRSQISERGGFAMEYCEMQNAETVLCVLKQAATPSVDELCIGNFSPGRCICLLRLSMQQRRVDACVDADRDGRSVRCHPIVRTCDGSLPFTPCAESIQEEGHPTIRYPSCSARLVQKWCGCCWGVHGLRFLTSHTVSVPAEDVTALRAVSLCWWDCVVP